MSDTMIRVENLGKKYIIGHKPEGRSRYVALRDVMANAGKSLVKRIRHPKSFNHKNQEEFWALQDVSFEVKQGECVGIIGRNGAGKSTLLKILSRITEPTTGRIELNGRVASLLEVGTGFHPELTGRENIYLNGAILGMGKAEIKKKFDEIVAFAEVEKFLDTPVKRYSSGMYVRLAFAVAAHLEQEILVVDEVLAVGDIAFQKKCLGKMRNVAQKGRTVLFVSHNLSAIKLLCQTVLLLAEGKIFFQGQIDCVLDSYIKHNQISSKLPAVKEFTFNKAQIKNNIVHLLKINLIDSFGNIKSSFNLNEKIIIEVTYRVCQSIDNFHFYARVFTEDGVLACASADWDDYEESKIEPIKYVEGNYRAQISIPPFLLNRGHFTLSLDGLIPSIKYIFKEENIITWEVLPINGIGGVESVNRRGVFRPLFKWGIISLSE